MVLFFFLIQKVLKLYDSRDERTRFKFFYTLGFVSFLVFQVFVNIGMNLGIMPIAGITLPLISYGGSSLVTFFIGLALLL
jgi:rod shape determining protein RodA